MKKTTLAILAVATVLLIPKIAISEITVQTQNPPEPFVEEIVIPFKTQILMSNLAQRRILVREKIEEISNEYGVNPNEIYATMAKCENTALDPNLQSGHRYQKDNAKLGIKAGDRERSFGLSQIHLPAHPSITKEQATDPEYAIEFMAKEFSKGNAKIWTCYKMINGAK